MMHDGDLALALGQRIAGAEIARRAGPSHSPASGCARRSCSGPGSRPRVSINALVGLLLLRRHLVVGDLGIASESRRVGHRRLLRLRVRWREHSGSRCGVRIPDRDRCGGSDAAYELCRECGCEPFAVRIMLRHRYAVPEDVYADVRLSVQCAYRSRPAARIPRRGNSSVSMVYQACGCRPQCGKCVPLVRQMLREGNEAAATCMQGGGAD